MLKLQKHIKSLFSLLLAFTMLMSLGGFSLYTHHCSHQNIKNLSIIIPAQECDHANEDQMAVCCKVAEEKSCCESKQTQEEDKGCCSDEQEYVKLTVDSILNTVSPLIKVLSFDTLAIFLSNFEPCEILLNRKLITESLAELPPPLSSPEYLSHIQVYII